VRITIARRTNVASAPARTNQFQQRTNKQLLWGRLVGGLPRYLAVNTVVFFFLFPGKMWFGAPYWGLIFLPSDLSVHGRSQCRRLNLLEEFAFLPWRKDYNTLDFYPREFSVDAQEIPWPNCLSNRPWTTDTLRGGIPVLMTSDKCIQLLCSRIHKIQWRIWCIKRCIAPGPKRVRETVGLRLQPPELQSHLTACDHAEQSSTSFLFSDCFLWIHFPPSVIFFFFLNLVLL